MKKLYFLVLFVLSFVAEAQIVNIPDANFKAKLLSASSNNYIAQNASGANVKIDTNDDNQIQINEAISISQLNVASSNISSLTGIEDFVNLTQLICDSNQLTSLNVTQNIALEILSCNFNPITSLNVTQNIALLDLSCF